MCLYPKFIKNRKYLPNKKNNNTFQFAKDTRTLYVPVGCGNCIECRQQKARAWQIRLTEELKANKHAYFITLTFSNEELIKLQKEIGENKYNAIAGIAIRRFLERWRKKHKKSIKHWLITELGHTNTERIHLHGILFTEEELTNDELKEIWKYGITDTGKYCNEQSICYVVKYMLKIDNDHKGYKAQIFCSAGLGKSYTENEFYKKIHKYIPNKTIEEYTTPKGIKLNMPIYYRNKFYTEEEREKLWLEKLDKQTIYVRGIKCKVNNAENRETYNKILKQAQKENIALGYGNDSKEWNEKEYNISLKKLNMRNKMLQTTEK